MLSALRAGAVAAVVAAAGLVVPRAASADEQSSVQAQISALRDQLAATGDQVHQLTAGYAAAEVQVQSIAQQAAVDQVQAHRAAAALAQSGAALRQELVTAYVGGVSQPSDAGAVGNDVANPSVRFGYLSIATSTMQDSVDNYRTAQLGLNSALSALAAEQRSAEAAANLVDRARQAALAEATAADTRLGDLEAQMTALEDKAAAQRAAQASHAGATGADPGGAGAQGGPVNGGLVSLVRAQVSPAPAPVAKPAPAPAPTTLPSAPVSVAPAITAPATTVPRTTLAPAPAPAAPQPGSASSGNVWLQLRECESGDDYQTNTGNGFFGAYQFSQQTWTDLGYPGRPDLEPAAMQDAAAAKLQAESGWGQWPACSAALGLT